MSKESYMCGFVVAFFVRETTQRIAHDALSGLNNVKFVAVNSDSAIIALEKPLRCGISDTTDYKMQCFLTALRSFPFVDSVQTFEQPDQDESLLPYKAEMRTAIAESAHVVLNKYRPIWTTGEDQKKFFMQFGHWLSIRDRLTELVAGSS